MILTLEPTEELTHLLLTLSKTSGILHTSDILFYVWDFFQGEQSVTINVA